MEYCYARRLRRPSPPRRRWMRRSDACSPRSAVDKDPTETLSREESMNQQEVTEETEMERTQYASLLIGVEFPNRPARRRPRQLIAGSLRSYPFGCINVERELHRSIASPGKRHDFM